MSALATHAKMVPTALTVSTATLVLVHLDLVASTVKSTHLIARKGTALFEVIIGCEFSLEMIDYFSGLSVDASNLATKRSIYHNCLFFYFFIYIEFVI